MNITNYYDQSVFFYRFKIKRFHEWITRKGPVQIFIITHMRVRTAFINIRHESIFRNGISLRFEGFDATWIDGGKWRFEISICSTIHRRLFSNGGKRFADRIFLHLALNVRCCNGWLHCRRLLSVFSAFEWCFIAMFMFVGFDAWSMFRKCVIGRYENGIVSSRSSFS